jgi:tetratricopeptide (TPR) repeat protein
MRRLFAVFLVILLASAAGANLWLRPKRMSIDQIKRAALKHRSQGNLDAFIAVLDNVPLDSPDKARAYLEQARAYWELSRGRAMEDVLQKCIALETHPASPREETIGAWGTLGDHYVGQERFEEATEVIWSVFDARCNRGNPDPFYLLLLLRLRFESAEAAVAIDRLEQFLANDPDDFDSHRALGLYLARTGKLQEARQHLDTAVQNGPDVPRFVESWLWYLFHTNEVDTAQELLDRLPAECDGRASFWIYRAKAANHRGDVAEMIACLRKALELEPHRIDANNLLAQALRQSGQKEEFQQRNRLCQDLASAFRELADIYSDLRNQPVAKPDPAKCRQISELCQQLRWDRDARGWAKLGESISSGSPNDHVD